MLKRRLGSSTLEVSIVGLGGNNFGGRIDFAATNRVVHKAIELGINLIDTADSYGNKGGSEEWLGKILREKSNQIVLATKIGLPVGGGHGGASRGYIMRAVEASLRRYAPIGSTFTSCIDPTRRRRSRRPCARSMTSCGRERSASSAAPTSRRSRSSRRRQRRGGTG